MKFNFIARLECWLATEGTSSTSKCITQVTLAATRLDLSSFECFDCTTSSSDCSVVDFFLAARAISTGLSRHYAVTFGCECRCHSIYSLCVCHQGIFVYLATGFIRAEVCPRVGFFCRCSLSSVSVLLSVAERCATSLESCFGGDHSCAVLSEGSIGKLNIAEPIHRHIGLDLRFRVVVGGEPGLEDAVLGKCWVKVSPEVLVVCKRLGKKLGLNCTEALRLKQFE